MDVCFNRWIMCVSACTGLLQSAVSAGHGSIRDCTEEALAGSKEGQVQDKCTRALQEQVNSSIVCLIDDSGFPCEHFSGPHPSIVFPGCRNAQKGGGGRKRRKPEVPFSILIKDRLPSLGHPLTQAALGVRSSTKHHVRRFRHSGHLWAISHHGPSN